MSVKSSHLVLAYAVNKQRRQRQQWSTVHMSQSFLWWSNTRGACCLQKPLQVTTIQQNVDVYANGGGFLLPELL